MIIEQIRREHGYMLRLLAILKQKLTALQDEKPINYGLVREIVDYLCVHSEKTHHPKEDILYNYFIRHYGAENQRQGKGMRDLAADHTALAQKSHEFMDILDMILQDAIVPQDVFVAQLESFIKVQKQHLDIEEKEILPAISERFSARDWQIVEAMWELPDDDPVFGDTIADKYRQLAQRVRRTD